MIYELENTKEEIDLYTRCCYFPWVRKRFMRYAERGIPANIAYDMAKREFARAMSNASYSGCGMRRIAKMVGCSDAYVSKRIREHREDKQCPFDAWSRLNLGAELEVAKIEKTRHMSWRTQRKIIRRLRDRYGKDPSMEMG